VEERDLTNPPGTHSVLYPATPFSQQPLTHSNWIVQDFASVLRKYRVIGVAPDNSNPSMYEIIGEIYSAEKHPLVEQGWSLTDLPRGSRPPVIVPKPRLVTASALVIQVDASQSYTLLIGWQPPINTDGSRNGFVTSYFVEFKRDTGEWGNRQQVAPLEARFENIGGGTFTARVAAVVDGWGRVSKWVESNIVTITATQYVADFSVARNSVLAVDW
jgi:hypothetical protein